MTQLPQITLLGMDRAELLSLMGSLGEPAYRANQILEAVYRQGLTRSTISPPCPSNCGRSWLKANDVWACPDRKPFLSEDGTVRYLIACADGQTVETVWMPEGDGGEADEATRDHDPRKARGRGWNRATICVSSQVGCAVDCQFCLTALLG